MTKRIFVTIAGLVLLTGLLAGIKALQIGKMISAGAAFVPPPEAVTTATAETQTWESALTSTGSLEAAQGTLVTSEMPGKVVEIAFEPGGRVNAGDLLIKQDTSSEEAQLRAAEAQAKLAKVNLDRIKQLLEDQLAARAQYDTAEANFNQAVAQADSIRAVIEKKTIRAPFSGRLGVRLVNIGQALKEGDPIVSLQRLDPIFVNFLLPQQELPMVKIGLPARVTTDVLSGRPVEGSVTAINPEVDPATRNIRIQATIPNPGERLRPGMFVEVAVVLSKAGRKVLAIPATAVLYAPFGDTVFVVEENNDPKKGPQGKVVRQQFVRLDERRGDFISVLSGLKEGETVVSTGVFKLRNGQSVIVNNALSPTFSLNPKPADS
jgi:membrane fusion protein (multidrug efflux system)